MRRPLMMHRITLIWSGHDEEGSDLAWGGHPLRLNIEAQVPAAKCIAGREALSRKGKLIAVLKMQVARDVQNKSAGPGQFISIHGENGCASSYI
jgi:hypothetical protein